MKKIFYSILMVLALFSCQKFDIEDIDISQIDGDKVIVNIGLDVPEMSPLTKAFGDDPLAAGTEMPLHIVVFDGEGMYVERATANFVSISPSDQINYQCTLTASSNKRILHLVGNVASPATVGTEYDVFAEFAVQGTQDAFWQRVVLDNGIRTDNGSLSPETAAKLTRVPVVRNYSKVTAVKASTVTNFTITGLTVVNTLNRGSVAPYNGAALSFVDYMKPSAGEKKCKTYGELLQEGYTGNIPSGTTLINIPSSLSSATYKNEGEPFYLYERTQPGDQTNTFAIIRGRYNGSTTDTYYKVDLIYNEGGVNKFYHILRNFNYEIEITHVSARGSATAAEAAAGTAFNNISADVQLKNLTNISDGTARLFVSYTDTIINTTNDVKFRFKYYPNYAQGTPNNNGVQIGVENGTIFSSGSVLSNTPITSGQWAGWNEVTLDVTGTIGSLAKRQAVTVIAPGTGLSREIRYVLRQKRTMHVTCAPKVLNQIVHANGDVHIDIPNDLDSTAFPLQFLVDTDTKSLYPRVDGPAVGQIMPLVVTVDANGRGSFAFQRTLTWTEYLGLSASPTYPGHKRITCWMETNEGVTSTTDDEIHVYVTNKYFNDGTDFFIRIPLTITNALLANGDMYGAGRAVTLTFTVNKLNEPLRINLTEGLVGSGSYAGQTEINLPPTTQTTVTIPLTTTTFGGPRTADIEHNVTNPEFAPVTVTATVNTLSVSVPYSGTVGNSNRNIYSDAGHTNLLGSFTTSGGNVTFTLTGTFTESTPLYFRSRYFSWGWNYTYASATVAQLLDPNFTLQFN
ncbi:MAG: hypothetical protein GXY75_07110 [Bacteroidales bacterium]|nr:hypothetical protein [Bacteroidales bacterium]